MKISIITVSFNSAETIERTLQSVQAQTDVDLEYIVVDGGSTDSTLEIVEKYKSSIDVMISEPDEGIYDAMNKGIKKATGDIVGILNSDDFYVDIHTLNKVVNSFKMGTSKAVYGDILYVEKNNPQKVVRRWKAGKYSYHDLKDGWIPPHPAFFVKREVYEKYGSFRTDFHIAADYEFMLRLIAKEGVTMRYLEEPLVYMQSGGNSASSFAQRRKGWKELKKAWEVNKLAVPNFFVFRRVISKIHQYFV